MKTRIFVKKIKWIDEDMKEADVEFEINGNIYNSFSHPCDLLENKYEEVDFSILSFDVAYESIFYGNEEKKMLLDKDFNDKWSYKAYGKISEINPIILNCGDISLRLPDFSRDKKIIGEYILFPIARLDIF